MSRREIPDLADRQSREKKAKHKALVDSVSVVSVNHFGSRLPRKIGTLNVDTGISNGYRQVRASYVLRMESATGQFVVEHAGVLYVANTREAIVARFEDISRIDLSLVWTRYIEIEYVVSVDSNDSWRNYDELEYDELELDDARDDRAVKSVRLTWSIVEFSAPFTIAGQEPGVMKREITIDDNGKEEASNRTKVRKLPAGLIEFTPARLATLLEIRAALTALDAKLVAVFRGGSKKLDAISVGKLLLGDGK